MNNRDKYLIAILSFTVFILALVINNAKPEAEIMISDESTTEQTTDNKKVSYQTETTTESTAETTTKTVADTTVVYLQETTTASDTSVNASAITNAEILSMLTNAVNKTKAYTGNVTVKHIESFEANVTECTGGSLAVTAANALVGMVLDPTDETLNFIDGRAQNDDDETVTILLPQKGKFSLPSDGIKSITASSTGAETIIKVTLVQESVGLYDKPVYNASGVGFLDVASLDLSMLEITSANIVYTGSTIEVRIRPDGYVSFAKYTIPVHVEGSAKSGILKGSAVFDGMQTEIWQFDW